MSSVHSMDTRTSTSRAAARAVADPPRIVPREQVEDIVARIRRFTNGDGNTDVTITSWWSGELRWARNRVSLSGDRRDLNVGIGRWLSGGGGSLASTNQTDDASLRALVRSAERSAGLNNGRQRSHSPRPDALPSEPPPRAAIWSDATYNVMADQQSAIAQQLTEQAEQEGMLSSGYLEMHAGEIAMFNTASTFMFAKDEIFYSTYTQAQCSMTVRHPRGTGSGWAGLSSYDWSAIDGTALADRSLKKCMASLNPVAVEPGRYTTILEPQAVCDIVSLLMKVRAFDREETEGGLPMPFTLGLDNALRLVRTKLGLKIVDERITLSHDPADPLTGILPFPGTTPVTWIERGVLKTLNYDKRYAAAHLHERAGAFERGALRMSGGTTSIEEMIASTKRGLLVTRFSGLTVLDRVSMVSTGVTRDGLWLIEGGKISKAVKNLRITESPLFVLNRIDQLGVPIPVFQPEKDPSIPRLTPAIVPALKVNDFSFTAMVDAV